DGWDIKCVGSRMSVKREKTNEGLRIRLDPPGRIVIEKLDMRFYDAHILASEKCYVVGRYISKSDVSWAHCEVAMKSAPFQGRAIDFRDPKMLKQEYRNRVTDGTRMATACGNFVMESGFGVIDFNMGISIARFCSAFDVYGAAFGIRSVSEMRKAMKLEPQEIRNFVGTGTQ
ncbi:MAG: hypothetical protein AAF067_01660, partial [Pseudomonadota bacterium]